MRASNPRRVERETAERPTVDAPTFEKQRELSTWRKLSLDTWKRPSDPSVYGMLEIDATRALDLLERLRSSTGVHVTLTHLVGKAVALAIRARPDVNAVIRRRRQVYLRETVDVFFQVALEGGEDLSGAKVMRADQKSVVEIARELARAVEKVRAHEDPSLEATRTVLDRVPAALRGLALRAAEAITYDLGLDATALGIPFDAFGSAMVTNVGTLGLPAGFAPLVPFARTPIVLTVGSVTDRPVALDGAVVVRPILPIGVTFDHRLLDGFAAGKLMERFLAVMRAPDRLDPEIGIPGDGAARA